MVASQDDSAYQSKNCALSTIFPNAKAISMLMEGMCIDCHLHFTLSRKNVFILLPVGM